MSHFFIERPVFAWVIAILIMLSGVLAIHNLPISQYPAIAPPAISINAYYPGASAKTVENTVTQIIEQKMTGIDNLLYFSSTSDSSGSSSITLSFKPGTDPDIAWGKVQNKLELAKPLLPQTVQQMGITVSKSTRNILMIVGLYSEDGSMNNTDLSDYINTNVQSILSRVEGVGEAVPFGGQYAMRIWLDPAKLAVYGLTPMDIKSAVRAYNVQVSSGQLGSEPAVENQQLNVSVNVHDLLKTPEEFGEIPIRINTDGSAIHLNDVATMELGGENYDFSVTYNGMPSGGMMIRLASGANALDTANAVKEKMAELSKYFPKGVKVVYPYDTTPFVKVAMKEVVKTLIEAIILVFIVMFLFLGSFRATLIPTIAVPVVLLGTFGVLSFMGYSINMLTMFAMVLAIGLLVDDAIVVVENVERLMHDEGLSPKEAARKSMSQITGALIGIGLVLSAVFGPMAFFGGSTGIIYRQFSVTIISAMLLSVVVALVLTPVLCATMLRPLKHYDESGTGLLAKLRHFFNWFNEYFYRVREGYKSVVFRVLTRKKRYLIIYAAIVLATGAIFLRLPTSYLPDEDQGMMLCQVSLPPGATLDRTIKVLETVKTHFLVDQKEAVESIMYVAGFSFSGRGQNNGMAFIKLRDWDSRNRSDLKVDAIAGRAMGALSQIRDGMVFVFAPPAVIELGTSKGFDFQLQDRGGVGHEKLMEARNQLLGMAMQEPALKYVRPNGLDDQPEYRLDIDWGKAGALGTNISEVNDTISTAWGSAYVNDFIEKGRVKRVYMQGIASSRMVPEDIGKWYVHSNNGEMVPFTSFTTGRWSYGSPNLQRYNSFPSINLLGEAAKGKSSGEAMKAVEKMAGNLPEGIGFEWTGLSYQEKMAGSQTVMLYTFSILVIFLCLAALYESWSIPFAVLVILPIGVFGAVMMTWMRGFSNDVYFQIGLLTTLGLTAKNAILIVQFAKDQMEKGHGLIEATLEGARLRLRPIIMTSMAFVLGVFPLFIAHGAGAGAMKAIGTGVIGGMLAATFIAIYFIPLAFVIVYKFFGEKQGKNDGGENKTENTPGGNSNE
jgi:hydrophobe/amphiphile efflux-1 (HAE1) family protein